MQESEKLQQDVSCLLVYETTLSVFFFLCVLMTLNTELINLLFK